MPPIKKKIVHPIVIANKQPREDAGLPSGEMAIVPGTFTHSQRKFQGLSYRPLLF